MLTTDEAWGRALATWSAESQAHLRTEKIDVFFSISFRNEAGLRGRTTVLRAIQKFLLENRGYSGLLPTTALAGRVDSIRRQYIVAT